MGFLNVRSISEDDRLPFLSDELRRLRWDNVELSKTKRPGKGEVIDWGYTYYWFNMNNGFRLKGVSMGITSKLQPFVIGVTPVDERLKQVRLQHTLCSISLVAVYASTEMCETEKNEVFYARFDYVLKWCPLETHSMSWANLILLLALIT